MSCIQRVKTVRPRLLHKHPGFTLLELIVVLSILGLLATIIVPNLRQAPNRASKEFVGRLNALTGYAVQRAIEQRKIHKVLFDVGKRTISLQEATEKTSQGELLFKPIKSTYLRSDYQWLSGLSFKNFYIDQEDKTQLVGAMSEVWFFIMPDGISQAVIINMVDKQNQGKQFALTLNPFSGQFTEHGTFQKP